jgi:cell wall-associated NlpC family hydrolase
VNTIAWVFILAAFIIIRSVAKGRALNLPQDLSDAFQALIQGNYDDLSATLGRTGDTSSYQLVGATVADAAISLGGTLDPTQIASNTNLAYWAYKLGGAAKGYRWAAAGPAYYDCSGLMYRAAQKVGYTGPRFWTGSVAMMPGMTRLASPGTGVSNVTAGDLVVWPSHHMGVVVGQNKFYSALNPRDGIGERPIQGFRQGETPIYLRFTPKAG